MPQSTARTHSSPASAIALAACTFGVPTKTELPGGLILLQVTPAGTFMPSDGREMDSPPWNIDAASAAAVIERYRATAARQPPVIDYEHQTLNKEKNGQPAPAAGWVRDLRWLEGQGLFAVVELTARAKEFVQSGEYLYFSPVFEYSRQTGTVQAFHMGALTNTPGIHGMQPLSLMAAATAAFISTPTQEHTVNPLLAALLAAFGLPATTTENDAIAALNAIGPIKPLQERAQIAVAACTALALPADSTADAVTAACTSLRTASGAAPDPAKYVPVAVVAEMQTNLAALTAKQAERDVDDLVKPAIADGRLLPVQEDWARDLGKTSLAALTSYLKSAQPIAALTQTQTGGKPPNGVATGGSALSADQLAVCAAMGIKPEDFTAASA